MDKIYGKTIKELADHMLKAYQLQQTIFKDLGMIEPNPINGFYGRIPFDGSLIIESSYGIPSSIYTPLGRVDIHRGGGMSDDAKTKNVFKRLGIIAIPLSEETGVDGGYTQYWEVQVDHTGNKYTKFDSKDSLLKYGEVGDIAVLANIVSSIGVGDIAVKKKVVDEYKLLDYNTTKDIFEKCQEIHPEIGRT